MHESNSFFFLFLYIGFVGFCLCIMTIFFMYVVNFYKPIFLFLLLIAQPNVRIFIFFYALILFVVQK